MLILHVRQIDIAQAPIQIGQFGVDGGTIGRAAECTLVLPDPERHISRIQAEIRCSGTQYFLRNRGGTNPLKLNSELLAPDESRSLTHGDEIVIAQFVMRVDLEGAEPSRTPTVDQALPGQLYRSWDNPETPNALTAQALASMAEQSANAHKLDFEPTPRTRTTAMLDDLNRVALSAARIQSAETGKKTATGQSSDESTAQLLQAFLQGAGLDELPRLAGMTGKRTLDAATMHRIGELLRLQSDGITQLLSSRKQIKNEIRAELTVISARNNNPLKFSQDSKAALLQLLSTRPLRGFLEGPAAVQDAMDDLLAHQAGFVAGMKEAMRGLIKRFDPDELEKRLKHKSMIDSMLPINRKAKLWELFTERYAELASEAEVDFEQLFGEEFLRAYEERINQSSGKQEP